MAKRCIFCQDAVDSGEHLWPEWVLEMVPTENISGSLGRHQNRNFGRELIVNCVCHKRCNGGWMSNLEGVNKPILGPMILDKSAFLDSPQQWTIAAWAMKTAMVMDAAISPIKGRRFNFYSHDEREAMRESWTIPLRTVVWLGRFQGFNIGGWSSTLLGHYPEDPILAYQIRATTILLGHLAIQILSARDPIVASGKECNASPRINPTKGPWDEILVTVWPPLRRVYWPPILEFHTSKTVIGIEGLAARWRQGIYRPFGKTGPKWGI